MEDRRCDKCTRQVEWGCTAKQWRTPPPGEADGPENWLRPAHMPIAVNGVEMWSCPRQSLHEKPRTWNRLLTLYAMYQKGFLPEAGAVIDQSNSLIEMFRILDDENAACDRVEAEARAREAARRGKQQTKGRR